jgi:hypothetical protein
MRSRRVATLVAAAASPVALTFGPLAGAAAAQDAPRPVAEDQVVLSGSVVVPRGERVGEVLVFTGSVVVNGVVEGDVVVFEGPVTIAGHVSGSVIAADGPVTLAESARIGGDVSAPIPIVEEPGAEVRGTVREDVRFSLEAEVGALGELLGPVAIAVSILLAGLLLLAIAPRGADASASALASAPLASVAWGLLVLIGVPILAVALSVLVLGLPLGLALLLSLGFWWLVGLTLAAWCTGRALVRPPRGRSLAFLAGWAIVAAVGLVPTINAAAWVLGAIVGLGAAVVATWRARHGGGPPGRHRRGLGVPDEEAAAAGLS